MSKPEAVVRSRSSDSSGNGRKATKRPVHGPKGAVATFVRPRDGQRIFVYPRNGEAVNAAITRVKKHNGAENVEHQTYV